MSPVLQRKMAELYPLGPDKLIGDSFLWTYPIAAYPAFNGIETGDIVKRIDSQNNEVVCMVMRIGQRYSGGEHRLEVVLRDSSVHSSWYPKNPTIPSPQQWMLNGMKRQIQEQNLQRQLEEDAQPEPDFWNKAKQLLGAIE